MLSVLLLLSLAVQLVLVLVQLVTSIVKGLLWDFVSVLCNY